MEGLINFKKMFMGMSKDLCERVPNGINPYNSATLAAACSRLYRGCFLVKNSLAIIAPKPHNESQSKKALMWIKIISHIENVYIRHARNNSELIIGGKYKVDGVYFKNNKKVIMFFYGCFWHGCQMGCYSPNDMNKVRKLSMGHLFDQTKRIEHEICASSPEIKMQVIWECEYTRLLATDEKVKRLTKRLKLSDPINIRECLRGGRCENFSTRASTSDEGGIHHYDFVSMYPAVQKKNEFPLFHPIIHTEQFPSNPNDTPYLYRGIIKCDVSPPRNLFIPVLPCKINNKLHFTLCRSCSSFNIQGKCDHSEEARLLTGVWTTPELKVAIEQGYNILFVYEVWSWNFWCSDIFREYVDTFYRLKVKASGFPDWCTTLEMKKKYVKELEAKEGVILSVDEIKYNKGLRTVAKLALVNCWGKLAQNLDHHKLKYISNVKILNSLISSKLNTINDIFIVNDQTIRVQYKTDVQNERPTPFSNVAIASFVTSYGRLHLYEQLRILNERTLYTDTDSCIFESYTKQDNKNVVGQLQCGVSLGKMVSELKEGEHITKFISLGSKVYSYTTNMGSQKLCLKGLPQHMGSKDIYTISNMENMLDQYLSGADDSINITYPYYITKDSRKGEITSKPFYKVWRTVIDKRCVDKITGKTYPFGY
jgi:hypothetical protein